MDYTRTHDKAKDLVMKEVDKLVDKGSLTPQELHSLYEAYETVEHICKAKEAEEMEMTGYSERGYSRNGYSSGWPNGHDRYYDIHAYNNGSSYRRDSMGRYSNTDGKKYMVDDLYALKNDAASEADRGIIQECINKLKA